MIDSGNIPPGVQLLIEELGAEPIESFPTGRAPRSSSIEAFHKLQVNGLNEQQTRVLNAWRYWFHLGGSPCSVRTLADWVSNHYGQHLFSEKSANEDVIRKRTKEIVTASKLIELPMHVDHDKTMRLFYRLP